MSRTVVVAFAAALLCSLGARAVSAADTSYSPVQRQWSRHPPGNRAAATVVQLVAVTFDDNFGLAAPRSLGGVKGIVDFYAGKRNPVGTGNAANFDGSAIKATFFDTCVYAVDSAQSVLGGQPGEDQKGRNRAAWRAAIQAGHETADHTVNHFNGGMVPVGSDACCRASNWSTPQWIADIGACRDVLAGIGARSGDVVGFRAPYLSYNDNMFSALQNLGLAYDSSLPNCFQNDEDGTNCSWPYTLDAGSPDAVAFASKFNEVIKARLPSVSRHPGLWELPPTTMIVPSDAVAAQYRFKPGLRDRVVSRGALPYPSVYEASTGKITGMDYTFLIDARVTGDEMRAILEYNLDLHLSGNRSPMIFIAHSHLYAFSNRRDNPDTPTDAERTSRWKGLADFIVYALGKSAVRIVSAKDVLSWVRSADLSLTTGVRQTEVSPEP